MKHILLTFLALFLPISSVFAITPTPSLTPLITPTTLNCTELTIVSGNNSYTPANLTFQINGSGPISKYRYYFGDGQTADSTTNQIQHTYNDAGNYIVTGYVVNAQGIQYGNVSCQRQVTVLALPVINNLQLQKSDCSNIFITAGNNVPAPSTVTFSVTGYDNKGSISKYKLDFGDSTTASESASPNFIHTYTKAGTYIARGYIYDTTNTWKGGGNTCQTSVSVPGTTTMTQQPNTGTPLWFTLIALLSGGISFAGILAILRSHAQN